MFSLNVDGPVGVIAYDLAPCSQVHGSFPMISNPPTYPSSLAWEAVFTAVLNWTRKKGIVHPFRGAKGKFSGSPALKPGMERD